MSAMIKIDGGSMRRLLGLTGTEALHKDKMGVLLPGMVEGEGKGPELVVNQKLTIILPVLDVRRYAALIVPHPALHEFAAVSGTSVIPPDMGPTTPRLHLVGLRRGNFADLPFAALVYLID